MDITAFIRELLFNHDCVIVPGFGGFIGNYIPARIDKSTSTFFPPVKQVSFNRNLNHNDGLLIGRISASLKVNYGDARNIVEEFVKTLKKKLEKGEKVIFDNIGSFINNYEGNIQFEPVPDVNYMLDSYGLVSFQFMPLEGYDVRRRITRHIDKEPVKHSSYRKVLWRSVIIIPLLAILVIVPTDLFRSKIETTTLNPLVTAEMEINTETADINVATVEVKTAGNEIIAQADTSIPGTPQTPGPEPAISTEVDIYLLITGSFKSEQNAQEWAGRLKADGYSPEILNAPNGFYRVSAMRCNGLEAAVNMKASLSVKFPGAWYKKI